MTLLRTPRRDAVLVMLVASIVGLVRYGLDLLGAAPLGDESAYLCAFDAVQAGSDPHAACPRFLYLPVLAHGGAVLSSWIGAAPLGYLLRLAILLGSAGVATVASGGLGATRPVRCAVAGLLMLSPPIAEGLTVGNLSAPAAALAWASLSTFRRRPTSAGVALGIACLVKPIAVLAPLALATVRGSDRPAAWRALFASVVVLGAGVAPWASETLRATTSVASHASALHNVSIVRVLGALGVRVSPVWIAVAVAVGLSWYLTRVAARAEHLAAATICGSLLALPVVWNHTMVAALPILTVASARAWSSWRAARGREDRSRAMLALLLVVLGGLAVLGSDVFGELFEADPWAGLPLLLPLCAPTALAAYAAKAATERAEEAR